MPNIASALKAEIARIARKEVKAETDLLKKATTRYRSEIAALKRQVALNQKVLSQFAKGGARSVAKASEDESTAPRHRFSAKRLANQRKRLDLSAEGLGLLIGVTGQSVYHWEQGKSRPRAGQLAAIAALRTLGKKQAAAIVASRCGS